LAIRSKAARSGRPRRFCFLRGRERAARRGVPVTTVAAQLGQSMKSLTLDTCSHLLTAE
jgi:hypothetical protein